MCVFNLEVEGLLYTRDVPITSFKPDVVALLNQNWPTNKTTPERSIIILFLKSLVECSSI